MAKSKEGKNSEFYVGQIRQLKSENRNLKKKLKHLERREHFFEEKETDPDDIEPVEIKEPCSECNKGHMEEINILDRIFKRCVTCGHRTKAIKVNG